MFFNFSKVLIAVVAATSASAMPSKRQADSVSCNFGLAPSVPVDPSSTNLVSEFNFVLGRSLAIDTGGSIFNVGSTILAENADGSFLVNDVLSADGKTASETAAILTSWVGETKEGIVANWLVQSVTCA
ncbi:hypothetical protein BDZ97DRAFT_1916013 [Flammula alnicola]|nr:hypothetical protein BDZ97DRAFT_1916013 [Flammula alnicola]